MTPEIVVRYKKRIVAAAVGVALVIWGGHAPAVSAASLFDQCLAGAIHPDEPEPGTLVELGREDRAKLQASFRQVFNPILAGMNKSNGTDLVISSIAILQSEGLGGEKGRSRIEVELARSGSMFPDRRETYEIVTFQGHVVGDPVPVRSGAGAPASPLQETRFSIPLPRSLLGFKRKALELVSEGPAFSELWPSTYRYLVKLPEGARVRKLTYENMILTAHESDGRYFSEQDPRQQISRNGPFESWLVGVAAQNGGVEVGTVRAFDAAGNEISRSPRVAKGDAVSIPTRALDIAYGQMPKTEDPFLIEISHVHPNEPLWVSPSGSPEGPWHSVQTRLAPADLEYAVRSYDSSKVYVRITAVSPSGFFYSATRRHGQWVVDPLLNP